MLWYRQFRSDIIQVFKMVHKYDVESVAVKLNFNTFSTTRANINCKNAHHYNLRKFSICSRVANICQTLRLMPKKLPIQLILLRVVYINSGLKTLIILIPT